MPEKRCRDFTLGDAMILVAALAIGMAIQGDSTSALSAHDSRIAYEAAFVHPLLCAMSVGFVMIRLRGPRPGRRRLIRQSGFVANCCPLLISIMLNLGVIFQFIINSEFNVLHLVYCVYLANFVSFKEMLPMINGIAVFVSWGLLLIGKSWRREPGWIGWFGLLLGSAWILVGFVTLHDAVRWF